VSGHLSTTDRSSLILRLLSLRYGSEEALDVLEELEDAFGAETAERAVRRFYVEHFEEEPPGGWRLARVGTRGERWGEEWRDRFRATFRCLRRGEGAWKMPRRLRLLAMLRVREEWLRCWMGRFWLKQRRQPRRQLGLFMWRV
jgi:hypothetical protein